MAYFGELWDYTKIMRILCALLDFYQYDWQKLSELWDQLWHICLSYVKTPINLSKYLSSP